MSSETSRRATAISGGTVTEADGWPVPVATLPSITPYFSLDAWRGLAALWVVMLHACLPYIVNGHQAFLRNPVYMVSIWGQLGVTVFFVISGYCITGAAYSSIAARKPITRFCADRVRRIYPPYLAALLFTLLISGATSFLQRHQVLDLYHTVRAPLSSSGAFWITNLTLTQIPGGWPCILVVAWSLCYEVVFYVIIACLLGIGRWKKGGEPAARLAVLTIGVSILTCGSLVWLCVSPATCFFPLELWYQFGLGSLLFLCVAVRESGSETVVSTLANLLRFAVATALILTAIFAVQRTVQVNSNQPIIGHPSSRVQAVATLILFALLYQLRVHDARLLKNRAVGVLAHLGAFSYSLYLVHPSLLPFIDAGLRRIGYTDGWYIVPFVLQIGVGVLAGWLFFHAIERRFISRRQTRRLAAE